METMLLRPSPSYCGVAHCLPRSPCHQHRRSRGLPWVCSAARFPERQPSLSREPSRPFDHRPDAAPLQPSLLRAVAATVSGQASLATTLASLALYPTPAESARTLVESVEDGTLATIAQDGWPLGTHIQFALDLDGRPVLELKEEAVHTGHVEEESRCSLHVQMTLPGGHRPQCTLKGHVRRADEGSDKDLQSSKAAWRRKFGDDADLEGVVLYQMDVDKVLYVPDIGATEVWVAGDEYAAARADPLKDVAVGVVQDLNSLSTEDIIRFCRVYGGIDQDQVAHAMMTWVDRLGFDLQVQLADSGEARMVRIPFPREVMDERDARSSITMMAQLAWERERNYIPPEIPLASSTPPQASSSVPQT